MDTESELIGKVKKKQSCANVLPSYYFLSLSLSLLGHNILLGISFSDIECSEDAKIP
jgi:hypothetical protein